MPRRLGNRIRDPKAAAAYLDAIAGRPREALRAALDLESRYHAARDANASSIGAIYMGLGRVDEALLWLTRYRRP